MSLGMGIAMIVLLALVVLLEAAILVLEVVRRPRKGKPEAPVKDEEKEYSEYLEKLWQEGLNGIMSYGIADAMGKKGGDR